MGAKERSKKLAVVLIAATIAVIGLVGISAAGAQDGGGACHGTYFVDVESAQSKALWSFNKDGTFQGTDSAESAVPFSHQQGAWQHTIARKVKATWLDFNFGTTNMARVDAEIEFDDRCLTFAGEFSLRTYDYGLNEDPLDPTDGMPGFSGSFTGERLNP